MILPNGEPVEYFYLPTGEPVEYEYDGNQRLISRKSSDGVDNFVQSGWDIVTKMDDVGKRTYYTGSSAVESEDSVKYFHFNHRGDTVLVTDANGEILHNLSYEAYGKPTNNEGIPINPLSLTNATDPGDSSYSTTGTGNTSGGSGNNLPNLFVGASGIRYDTKTNLHYMRFRWFSPDQMRFISSDLINYPNKYSYVKNNPIDHIDPLGLWEPKETIKYIERVAKINPRFKPHLKAFPKAISQVHNTISVEPIPLDDNAMAYYHHGTKKIQIPYWYTDEEAAFYFVHEYRHRMDHDRTSKKTQERPGWCYITEINAWEDSIIFFNTMRSIDENYLKQLPDLDYVILQSQSWDLGKQEEAYKQMIEKMRFKHWEMRIGMDIIHWQYGLSPDSQSIPYRYREYLEKFVFKNYYWYYKQPPPYGESWIKWL